MIKTLLNKKFYKFLNIIALLCFVTTTNVLKAQNTLETNDALFVALNSQNKVLEITTLKDIKAGADFYIVVNTWDSSIDKLIEHPILEFTVDTLTQAGSIITINLEEGTKLGSDYEIIQLFEKKDNEDILLNSIARGDRQLFENQTAEYAENTVYLGEKTSYRYFIRNGVSGTVNMLQNMISNADNWVEQNEAQFVPTSNFNVLKPPVILFSQNSSTINDDDEFTQLDVLIYEHDGSKLTVNVELDSLVSTLSAEELDGFTSQELNFSGIMGNDTITIDLPLQLNSSKNLRKTGVFTLSDLSSGSYGDFATHTLIINNTESSSVNIRLTKVDNKQLVQLNNYGGKKTDISGWVFEKNGKQFTIPQGVFLEKGELLTLTSEKLRAKRLDRESTILSNKNLSFLTKGNGTISLYTTKHTLVDKINYREEKAKTVAKATTQIVPNIGINVQSINNISSATEMAKTFAPGWYALQTTDDLITGDDAHELYFWSEKDSEYQKINRNISAINSNNVISYFDRDNIYQLEELIKKNKLKSSNYLEFTLSATDLNENGVIDNAEGINKAINSSSTYLSAQQIYKSVADVGLTKKDVVIFSTTENGTQSLDEDGFIAPGQLFWIKINTPLEPIDLAIEGDDFKPFEESKNNFDEKPALTLKLESENDTSAVQIYFKDDINSDNIVAKQTLDNFTELMLPFGKNQSMALMDGINQLSTIAINFDKERVFAYPISVAGTDNIDFKLTALSRGSFPDNYEIFLEDTFEDKTYDLRRRVEIPFTNSESSILDLENEFSKVHDSPLFKETRFILKMLPVALSNMLDESELPKALELYQNYPNPFNPHTTISFYLPEDEDVKLSVYNVVGQPIAEIIHARMTKGEHRIDWDATDVPSGMYIYQLEVGTKIMTRKMTIVK